MTSAELAELVDLSHDFIRQIESTKAAYNFSVDTFYKISVALGVTLDDLIKWLNDKYNLKCGFVRDYEKMIICIFVIQNIAIWTLIIG